MSEQLFLEAFNSEPYFFEKEEKYGAMDIIYTFEDEAGHGFKFHFEKKVALGKHAYVCVLSQKTPGLKTYKRVIGKFSNPMRTVATLLAVVRDIHDTRKDVHGIVMSIPEQAFGSYARLVKKIMTRELRTVLNVEDGEYTPEDFEKMGLVGIVTTVKPRNMNTVYTGPALKEYQERQAGKDGAGISTPAAAVPDVKAPAAVKKPDFAAPVQVEFNVHAPDGRTLTLTVDHLSGVSTKDLDGNFVSEKVFKNGDNRLIVTGMREYTNVAKMIPLIQMSLNDGYTVVSVPQYRGKVASKGITELNKPDDPVDLPKQTSVAQTMPTQVNADGVTTIKIEVTKFDKDSDAAFNANIFGRASVEGGIALRLMRDKIKKIAGKTGQLPVVLARSIFMEGETLKARFDSNLLAEVVAMIRSLEGAALQFKGLERLEDLIPKQPVVAQTMPVQGVKSSAEINYLDFSYSPAQRTIYARHGGNNDEVYSFEGIERQLSLQILKGIKIFVKDVTLKPNSTEGMLAFKTNTFVWDSTLNLIADVFRTSVANVKVSKDDQKAQQPAVDPVAEKENFYFDYDHRQITLTFNDKETAGRIKDQLLELGAATFNGNEFFTDKETLILVDDKSLDVKKVQETLFPILGNPLLINDHPPNIRSSVRSPDGVIYRIKGNTIQVEDAPKDSAMTIVRELIPMADRIFDDKGSNTLELNEQGIADGFTMYNIAPVFKKSNISKRLSARLFRSWESAVTEASNKYDLSTGVLGSSFTNNSSYLIDAATSGVVGEYLRTDGNVISGIVLNTNYMIREAVAKPLVALGFTVEYDVQGWRTQVKLPVNSDYTIPGTSELAVFIKEVDNLANIASNRTVEEFVGGNKDFRAKWHPDTSRVFLVLPTADSSGLAWRDYTAYATAPQYVRVDDIKTYEEFLKLVEFTKNFDFGANLLRNIGVSKYLSDVRSGGAKASKSYKLKDGGEVEISFKFGDKVTFIFNQNSEGFDKEMSEFASEKMEIFGRASAIPLYMLGTADANKTLKNIDAWLDAHIVIKEDLTGKAPNRVKRELLEATLQKLGLYRESFTYGNATFKTTMSECSVEIVPTSGNIRNFAKMLGARLGQELRIDDEGFLSFDLDNI